jgi:hypothetical protein
MLRDALLPIDGPVYVFWGGTTKEQNYHIDNRAQKFAFDFCGLATNAKRFRSDGTTNEDYFVFGRQILAPADGMVIEAVDGIRDNIPKKMNAYMVLGNSIILRHSDRVFSVLAHLKLGSVSVKPGDHVIRGQRVALCGNSGRSSEPHLHFHVQNSDNMTEAEGIPCTFRRLKVENIIREDYSPVRLDIVENVLG